MRKKIVGIFVCTLLIATAIPAVGTMNTTTYKKYNLQYANSIEWNLTYGGDEFDAIISGVTSFGLFVELLETFISGAVPIHEMKDDYYIYESKAHRLIGEESLKTFQMGDLIRVRLDHVDMMSKKVTFSLSE